MTEYTYKDTALFIDIRDAIVEDWYGFVVNSLFIGGLVFISLHVGVKLGYSLAYFETRGYPPSSLTGRASIIADVLLAVGVAAFLVLATVEVYNVCKRSFAN